MYNPDFPFQSVEAVLQMFIEAKRKPHDIVIYTDGLGTSDWSRWGFTIKRVVQEENGVY